MPNIIVNKSIIRLVGGTHQYFVKYYCFLFGIKANLKSYSIFHFKFNSNLAASSKGFINNFILNNGINFDRSKSYYNCFVNFNDNFKFVIDYSFDSQISLYLIFFLFVPFDNFILNFYKFINYFF